MIITTIMENDSLDQQLHHTHGLSQHIRWRNLNLLFDLGPNSYYLDNAKLLGIDLNDVDKVILSHGHYDHGGGLNSFLVMNHHATIYASSKAFEKQSKKLGPFYIPIGVKRPKSMTQFHLIDTDETIEDGFYLYQSVPFSQEVMTDWTLYTMHEGKKTQDHFEHEIYLVLEENERVVLFSGCSHKGIENIISAIEKIHPRKITDVVGGFHLMRFNPTKEDEVKAIKSLGEHLKKHRDVSYYSCHCTGDIAYATMKVQMGEQLQRIKTGSVLEIQ